MNILLCTKYDLVGNLCLNQLRPMLAQHNVKVVLSDNVSAQERALPAAQDFMFYVRDLPLQHVFPALDAVPSDPFAPCLTFQGLRQHCGWPIEIWGNPNQPEYQTFLRAFAPDMILSIRYGYILRQPLLQLGAMILNLHPGALPQYQGVYPPLRAMMQQQQTLWATLHQIEDEQVDCGAIVATLPVQTQWQHSVLWHIVQLYTRGCSLIGDVLNRLQADQPLLAEPQSLHDADYFAFPTAAELQQAQHMGLRLFDHQEYLGWLQGYQSTKNANGAAG